MFPSVLAKDCKKMSMFLALLFYIFLPISSSKLTTLLKDKNLTSLEERLANLEQTIERRLNVTERVLGQLLTGKDNDNLEDIDVLALRSGKFYFTSCFATAFLITPKKKMRKKELQQCVLSEKSSL